MKALKSSAVLTDAPDSAKPNTNSDFKRILLELQERESLFEKVWMTTEMAAAYLKVSPGSLRNMTSNGQVPYVKFGRRNRYLKSELDKLLLSQKHGGNYGN